MPSHRAWLTSVLLLGVSLSGCKGPEQEAVDEQLRLVIQEQGLSGDPSPGRDLPHISSPLAQLGMQLFYSKALGGDKDSACVTCHHPVLGGADGLSLAIGVAATDVDQLGPGRSHRPGAPGYDGGPTVPRNVLSTFNSAFYDQGLFWDSRVESLGKTPGAGGDDGYGIRTPDTPLDVAAPGKKSLLHAQAGMPVTSPEEMRGFSFEAGNGNDSLRNHLAARLGNVGVGSGELVAPRWQEAFRQVYGDAASVELLISFDRIAEAIAAFEASQVFVNTPWRSYVRGDLQAISAEAKRGALLFFLPPELGGADCARCHRGDFFTDEEFHVIATPQIGRGKGDGLYGDDDYGRYRETGVAKDRYAFRTPNLLNLKTSGPYGHAGAYTTLEGIVRHHLNPAQALASYDPGQLAAGIQIDHLYTNTWGALAQLSFNRANGVESLQDIELSDSQVDELLAFLDTLNDPCAVDRDCLAPWIPDAQLDDPDGLRLLATDQYSRPL